MLKFQFYEDNKVKVDMTLVYYLKFWKYFAFPCFSAWNSRMVYKRKTYSVNRQLIQPTRLSISLGSV